MSWDGPQTHDFIASSLKNLNLLRSYNSDPAQESHSVCSRLCVLSSKNRIGLIPEEAPELGTFSLTLPRGAVTVLMLPFQIQL
jgi:hypothetical protein